MCGIVAVLHPTIPETQIIECFNKGQHRGPDNTSHISLDHVWLGFHRLAINGLDSASNQPFYEDNVYLICNGEIYNYRELFSSIGKIPFSNSDCEILLHLYLDLSLW